MPWLDPFVKGMASMRILSAAIEISAALLMLKLNRVDASLRINGLLGLVGPAILLTVTLIGVAGLAGRVETGKILLVLTGVGLILLGTRS